MEKGDIPTSHELLSIYKSIHHTLEKHDSLEIFTNKLFDFTGNFYSQDQMQHFH